MIETVFGVIISSFLGVIFVELRDMRTQINKIENEIIILNFYVPKRKTDVDIMHQEKVE